MSTKRDLIHDTPDRERGAGPVLDPDHDHEHDSDVNSGVNSGGPYVVLMLRADGAGWDDTYDTQHPDGLLRRRIWQLLASCVGTGRLYSTQRSTVVVWDHEQTLDIERAVATLTADPVLSRFVRGYLIQARPPRLGQILGRLEDDDTRWPPSRTITSSVGSGATTSDAALDTEVAPVVDLRGSTLLSRGRFRPGERLTWHHGLG